MQGLRWVGIGLGAERASPLLTLLPQLQGKPAPSHEPSNGWLEGTGEQGVL